MNNVSKKFPNGVMAVSDFSIDIADKEFIILVGPSGCGKSTTLRMIAGLENATDGEIYIDDRLVNDVPPKDRDIAMVFQNYALYPHMTVYENISFGLRIRKLPRDDIRRRVEEAAEILEIKHLLDRKPGALSGGQRQRVALGRAIVRDPKVFLLDEPLSNLDAKLRTAMRTELSKLHKRLETTFVYVTHDQTEAMTMGTRIVVLNDGYVQQIAPPQELYDRPVNLFVATFIGSPQMNVFEARLSYEDGTGYLTFGEGDCSKIALPEDISAEEKVRQYNGEKLLAGIRPGDIYCGEALEEKYQGGAVSCTVDLTEMLGSDTNVYLKTGGLTFIAEIASNLAQNLSGDVTAYFDTPSIHLFDMKTERSILYGSVGEGKIDASQEKTGEN